MADALASKFNQTLSALIRRLERKSRSDEEIGNLDRLKRRLTLLKSTMGVGEPLRLAAPIFTEFSERILAETAERDAFFLGFDVRGEYIRRKGRVDPDDEPIFALIDSVRAHYRSASADERNAAVEEVKVMLTCCLTLQMETAPE